ncbi:MAG TPA: hypothetical protein VIL92_00090 [Gaiellaceae bacterium]
MSDGDIWGGGRLTTKWLAVGSQREADIAHGVAVSQELADLTAHALADTFRRADRRPCEPVIEALIAHRHADLVAWQGVLEGIEREWGSTDGQIACRAAVPVRRLLVADANDEACRLAYFESYAAHASRHMESTVNARIGREDAPSALLAEHAQRFARQLAKGPEAKIRAPNRTAQPKGTRDILEMDVL